MPEPSYGTYDFTSAAGGNSPVSCPTANWCAFVGRHLPGLFGPNAIVYPVLGIYDHGTVTVEQVSLGGGNAADLGSISCWAPNQCKAIGMVHTPDKLTLSGYWLDWCNIGPCVKSVQAPPPGSAETALPYFHRAGPCYESVEIGLLPSPAYLGACMDEGPWAGLSTVEVSGSWTRGPDCIQWWLLCTLNIGTATGSPFMGEATIAILAINGAARTWTPIPGIAKPKTFDWQCVAQNTQHSQTRFDPTLQRAVTDYLYFTYRWFCQSDGVGAIRNFVSPPQFSWTYPSPIHLPTLESLGISCSSDATCAASVEGPGMGYLALYAGGSWRATAMRQPRRAMAARSKRN